MSTPTGTFFRMIRGAGGFQWSDVSDGDGCTLFFPVEVIFIFLESGPDGKAELLKGIWLFDKGTGTEFHGLPDFFAFGKAAGNDGLLLRIDFENLFVGLAAVDAGIHEHIQEKKIDFLLTDRGDCLFSRVDSIYLVVEEGEELQGNVALMRFIIDNQDMFSLAPEILNGDSFLRIAENLISADRKEQRECGPVFVTLHFDPAIVILDGIPDYGKADAGAAAAHLFFV